MHIHDQRQRSRTGLNAQIGHQLAQAPSLAALSDRARLAQMAESRKPAIR
jgi:hypothetical protein